MKASFKRVLRYVATAAVWTYFGAASLIFVPYYNWQYASEHGFFSWVVFGEIIPSAKALAWAYFIFAHSAKPGVVLGWTETERANSKHMLLSWQADLAAIRLSNGRTSPVLSAEEEAGWAHGVVHIGFLSSEKTLSLSRNFLAWKRTTPMRLSTALGAA